MGHIISESTELGLRPFLHDVVHPCLSRSVHPRPQIPEQLPQQDSPTGREL